MNLGVSVGPVFPQAGIGASNAIAAANGAAAMPTTTSAAAAAVPMAAAAEKIFATTTTKAFSVTIAVPKIHRCYVPMEEEEEEEEEEHNHHHDEEEEAHDHHTDTGSFVDAAATATQNTAPSSVTGSIGLPTPPSLLMPPTTPDNDVSVVSNGTAGTNASSLRSHRSHRRAQTFGGQGHYSPDKCHDGNGRIPNTLMVYDDTITGNSSSNSRSHNHHHPFLSKLESKQAAIEWAKEEFGDQAKVTNATIVPVVFEGVHATEGVVVTLEPKSSAAMSRVTSNQNLAALSQQQQQQDSLSAGMDTSSVRSRMLSRADRNEVMSLMSADDGNITPPASIGGDPLDQLLLQQQLQHVMIEPDHELIGYVKGAESPPMNKRGHKKTASNIPVIKDIVTAEELAAIVKIPPAVAPPPPASEQQQPPKPTPPLPHSMPTNPPVYGIDFEAQLNSNNGGGSSNGSDDYHPLRGNSNNNQKPSPTNTNTTTNTSSNFNARHDHNRHQSMTYSSGDSDFDIDNPNELAKLDGALQNMVFGTTTPLQHSKRHRLGKSHDSHNRKDAGGGYHEDLDKTPKRRVSYMTEAAAADAIRRSCMSSNDFSRYALGGCSPSSSTDGLKPRFSYNEEDNSIVAAEPEPIPVLPAAAVADEEAPPGPPQPNTEIRVAVLVALALKQLREDGHLLNRPVSIDVTANDTEWTEFTILAKDPSIGIILERLERIGVGSSVGSVSIFKLELCRTADLFSTLTDENDDDNGPDGTNKSGAPGTTTSNNENPNIAAARTEWKNAASRLRVEQVKEQIHEQAALSFDYVSLLVVASILAGIGLVTNSTVVIVASMLVSPIMGPVMGMTFGSRVLDWELTTFSLKNELVSLTVCVFIGIMVALCSAWTPSAQEWPTEEMAGRGAGVGLIAGVAIAIPSGMGVALSILGNNTSSLVGVAISASLLPPAVNAGICWMYALLLRVGLVENIVDSNYKFGLVGTISLALTVINILCIWIAGIAMFTIKEVAPSKAKGAFWEQDIKTARALKKGNKKINMDVIRVGLQDAIQKEDLAKQQGKQKRRMTLRRRPRRPSLRSPPPGMFDFNLRSNPSLGKDAFEDAIDDMLGPSPLFDEVHHGVGSLSDLAELLGFDQDANEFVEETEDQVRDEETPPSRHQSRTSSASISWYKVWLSTRHCYKPTGIASRSKQSKKVGRILMFFVFGNMIMGSESFSFAHLTKKSHYGSTGVSPTPATLAESPSRPNMASQNSEGEGSSPDPSAVETELTALIDVENSDIIEDKDEASSTGRRILELAVPALGALLIDPLLTLADTAFVGRFAESPYELAGMGSATALLTFSFYIFNFLCTATTPLVASKRSSGNEEEAIAVGRQSLSLALALGGVLAALLIAFRYPLLELMGTAVSGEEATGYALDFLVIRALAAPAVFIISAATGILRGYLDTKTPIYVLLVANVVNFLLDVVLIVVMGMGPAGAALATTTAEWISALLFLFVLSGQLPSADGELGRKTEEDGTGNATIIITPTLSIPAWQEVQPLVVASSAVFLRTTILQLFLSSSAALAARGGDGGDTAAASISAHQIAIQLWMLCSYTSDALAAASQGLVADAIGRNSHNQVTAISKTVLVYSTVLGTILATLLGIGFFSTDFLLTLFTTNPETQADLMDIAVLLVVAQPLNSLVFAADGILQGASEFPYQAKSMAISASVAALVFILLQQQPQPLVVSGSNDERLFQVWSALIVLQFLRGVTSAYKIVDAEGPIRLLE